MSMKEVFGDQIDNENFGKTLSGALVLVGPEKEAGAKAIKYHDRLIEAIKQCQGYHLMHLEVPNEELTFGELRSSAHAYHSSKSLLCEMNGEHFESHLKNAEKPNFSEPRKFGRTKIVDKHDELICDCADEWTRDTIFASIIDNNDHGALAAVNEQFNKALRSLKIAGFKDNGGELWQPPVNAQAGETIQRLLANENRLVKALEDMIGSYCDFVNSGDGGNWSPEEDKEVIEARAALKMAKGALNHG